jgi:hypothetical protein
LRERERERERSIVKEERDLKEDIGNPFWKIRVLSRHGEKFRREKKNALLFELS